MEIYIPSSGRSHKQPTWNSLSTSLRHVTKLVVPPDEATLYNGYPVIHDPGIPRVGAVRQWIADQATGNFLMLDDDLSFAIRRKDEPTKFSPASENDVEKAIREIFTLLRNGYALVGIAMREGANRNTSERLQAIRMARVYGYNLKIIRELGIQFDRCLAMDDFDVALQLLRAGYPNVALNWIVQNQYGSNASGGASQWRDATVQEESAKRLEQYHPAYVKIVQKKTKVAWGWGERTDVVVQWKKALYDAR